MEHPTIEAADDDDLESDSELEVAEDDSLAEVEDELDDDVEEGEDLISGLQAAVENCSDQKAKGNQKFIQKFAASQASTRKLVEEITSLRNRCSMPQTWASYRHPATMYYR